MAKFEIEVDDCAHCPCLRNNKYGEFCCFYNDWHTIDTYHLDVIDEDCPLKGGE